MRETVRDKSSTHKKMNIEEPEDNGRVEWSTQVEDILAGEGEKCRGLAWIHMRCESEMSQMNTWVQVPVIILSTLAGTASVGSSTLFGSGNSTVSGIAIGLVSISVGILNTLGGFFNFAKRSEAHRIAHLHYSKISSKIQIELSLPRMERDSAESLLNYVRDSMERLAETTPLASQKIVNSFNTEFKDLKDKISMPPETNGLHKFVVYRSHGPVPTPKFSFDVQVPDISPGQQASFIASKAQSIVNQAASQAKQQVEEQASLMLAQRNAAADAKTSSVFLPLANKTPLSLLGLPILPPSTTATPREPNLQTEIHVHVPETVVEELQAEVQADEPPKAEIVMHEEQEAAPVELPQETKQEP